jgi:hypothetical protein
VSDALIDWWRRRRWTTPRYTRLVRVASRNDLPELPPRRNVAVVGGLERPKWAVFSCPCGHGHVIAVNLSPARRPVWELLADEKAPGLRPSVDSMNSGRRCHFWLREGRVQWVWDDF